MGEVPALQLADDTVLTESMVICRYLDDVRTGGNEYLANIFPRVRPPTVGLIFPCQSLEAN